MAGLQLPVACTELYESEFKLTMVIVAVILLEQTARQPLKRVR